ncbi:hypothetical protein BHE74_00052825 [Ensete ventricosum]|nr:hypothetical protein GW17_00051593 [Ensete ventricosum]RWW41678.1 hypothetical protein BHE74_00052825 [Ensete ventricosum]
MKYVVVTGGVVSGLGKGVTASSIGVVLKACDLRVTSIKIGKSPGNFCLVHVSLVPVLSTVDVFCYLTDLPCYIKGSKTHMGGTMRLGSRRTYFKVPSCKAAKL